MCFLTDTMGSTLLIIVVTSIAVATAVDPGPTKDSDDVYQQLLRRVESLEKRDQQQQAEIDTLRGELNTEKQRNVVLEGRLARLYTGLAEQREKDVATTTPADAKTVDLEKDVDVVETTSSQSGEDETSREASSDIPTGQHPSRVRRQVDVPVVAFHATLSNHTSHIGLHQAIAFDRIVTNIGAAYNPHVGLFLAPVTGVYVFHTTIMGYAHYEISASISKNGVEVANVYVRGVEAVDGTGSAAAVIHLSKGDDVIVQHLRSDKTVHGYHYSMFSGFLLHQDDSGESIVG